MATSNKKMMVLKIRPCNYKLSQAWINNMLEDLIQMNDGQLMTRMKEIVPEFISNNSQFESLDKGESYLKLALGRMEKRFKMANHLRLKTIHSILRSKLL